MQGKKNRLAEVTKLAMKLGQKHLSDYGAVTSRKDFTQRQLMTCLVLKAYLKTTYRGVIEFLETSSVLREIIGLPDKLPHYSTLAKFAERSSVMDILAQMIQTLGGTSYAKEKQAVAMDATGMETSGASAHFVSRAGRERKKWVKVSVAVLCGSLIPMGVAMGWGPSSDRCQVLPLIEQSFAHISPDKVYADAGYDAEWVHGVLREHCGVSKTVIKPARCAKDGSRKGEYRSEMSEEYLKKQAYGMRWKAESYMSGLKRTTGSTLNSRKPLNMLKEAAFKVLAYALNR